MAHQGGEIGAVISVRLIEVGGKCVALSAGKMQVGGTRKILGATELVFDANSIAIRERPIMKRFDHLIREFQFHRDLCVKHINGATHALRLARREAFRMARVVNELREQYHNELLDYVATEGATIESWMDESFRPVEQCFLEKRADILRDVAAGMTEAEYLKEGQMWGVKKRVVARDMRAQASLDEIPESPSVEEERDLYKARCASLKSELREIRRDLARVTADNERLRRMVERYQRDLKRANRTLQDDGVLI